MQPIDRKTIDKAGLSSGGLVAIILGITGFIFFSIAGFLYAFSRIRKSDTRWRKKSKAMMGTLPQAPTQLNMGDLNQVSFFIFS